VQLLRPPLLPADEIWAAVDDIQSQLNADAAYVQPLQQLIR